MGSNPIGHPKKEVARLPFLRHMGSAGSKVTVAGIYAIRRLQIKRCGWLDPRAVLALDSCPVVTRSVQIAIFRRIYDLKCPGDRAMSALWA